MPLSPAPRALLFDVFGTCVDWRSTVTRTLESQAHDALNDATLSLATSLRMRASNMTTGDWGKFAQQWRSSYGRFTQSLAADPTIPWQTVDEHHLEALQKLLVEWNLECLWTDEQVRALSLVWHRLDPWEDSSRGITELNKVFWTATLSNGNLTLLADLRVHARLDFTHIFSAEQFGSYKPSPTVYLGAVEKLGLAPNECAMVASHLGDLKAAKGCGLQAIYVERPLEEDYTPDELTAARTDGWVDLWVEQKDEGFVTVAERLGIEVDKNLRRVQSE
jgi:2-haloacid dehalogenase